MLAGLFGMTGAVHAQQWLSEQLPHAQVVGSAMTTSNLPSGSGEASTMTNGVPNLLASNPQAGELGIQTRLSVRHSKRLASSASELNVMGAPAAQSLQQPSEDP